MSLSERVCEYVDGYACICVCARTTARALTCAYVWVHMCLCECAHACVRGCECICVCACGSLHVRVGAYMSDT